MKRRYILYRRKRGGMFYIADTETRKQESTGTRNRAEATSLLNARNESIRQPQLNLHLAKVYLAGTDSGVSTRTWQNALDAIIETKSGPTQDRWRRAAKERALDIIRHRVIIETQAEHLFACLKAGTVSTNVHLRKLHNFCLSMNWLPWPLIPKRLWPEVTFQPTRAITIEEHHLIIEREKNPEAQGGTLCKGGSYGQFCIGLSKKNEVIVARIASSILRLVCACQGSPHQRWALRAGFLVCGSTVDSARRAGEFASRISRRDWWPDQDTAGELDIITGSQENGEVLHQAGMNFFCPSAEIFSPKPVSSSSNLLPCKGEWFWEFRDQETGR
jgi:hypothetical protein